MKHINITNWQGNITDWTKFNYVYGGLDDTLADRVNLRIPGTNLRNYIRKSINLVHFEDIAQADFYDLNFKVENGVISVWGTATKSVNLWLNIVTVLPANTRYSINFFHSGDHEGKIIYNIAKSRSDWTNRVYTESPSFTFQRDYTMSAICLQFDANKQYNCTFKPMVVYGYELPTTYEPYGSMVMVENVATYTFTGNETFTKFNKSYGTNVLDNSIKQLASNANVINASLPGYTPDNANNVYNGVNDNTISGIVAGTPTKFRVYSSAINSPTEAQSALAGKTLTYELKEPKVTVFNQVDLGESASQPSASTLSMASPMQLDKTNVEEDIEYLEDTKFNEEILSEEE